MKYRSLFTPSIEHRYRIENQYSSQGEFCYLIKIFNGPVIDTILEQDLARMNDSLITQMEYCVRRGDVLWNMFFEEEISHKAVLVKMINIIAFELAGTFTIRIGLPECFFVLKDDDDDRNDFLALNYSFEPELNIIEKIRASQ